MNGTQVHELGSRIVFVPDFSGPGRGPRVRARQIQWSESSSSFETLQTDVFPENAEAIELEVSHAIILVADGPVPELESSLEWSLDGEPAGLGPVFPLEFHGEGAHSVSVGPAGSETTLRLASLYPGTGAGHGPRRPIRNGFLPMCFSHACAIDGDIVSTRGSQAVVFKLRNTDSGCEAKFVVRARYEAPRGYEWPATPVGGHVLASVTLPPNGTLTRSVFDIPMSLSALVSTGCSQASVGAARIILDVYDDTLSYPSGFKPTPSCSITVLDETVACPPTQALLLRRRL